MKHNFYHKLKLTEIVKDIDLDKEINIGDVVTLHSSSTSTNSVVEDVQYHVDVVNKTEWVEVYVR